MYIAQAYMSATDEQGAPTKREDLIPYLQKFGNPEEILISDNDKAEFVILWNIDYRTYLNEGKLIPVTAYEKKGMGGRRYVLQGRVVSTLTDAQFDQVAFPPGHKPPS